MSGISMLPEKQKASLYALRNYLKDVGATVMNPWKAWVKAS